MRGVGSIRVRRSFRVNLACYEAQLGRLDDDRLVLEMTYALFRT